MIKIITFLVLSAFTIIFIITFFVLSAITIIFTYDIDLHQMTKNVFLRWKRQQLMGYTLWIVIKCPSIIIQEW